MLKKYKIKNVKGEKMDKEKSKTLKDCLAQSANLCGLIDYASDAVVSKTILDKTAGTITLFAFDKGQKLSEHSAPYDAVVEVIDGSADIIIDGNNNILSGGGIIIMPANIPHAVEAVEKFKMLLIMIRS
jgi:quercetin dioxygenase-like cupin family protein